MAKKFNETGLCFPEDHYMADISKKLAITYQMVEDGVYFIINRPRQYGKTTIVYTIAEQLIKSGEYVVFNISFEGIGDEVFLEEKRFSQGFVKLLSDTAFESAPELTPYLKSAIPEITNLQDLHSFISDLVNKAGKKVVLLIDEVDKSSNNQLFISFLAILRNKYLDRRRFKTFHAVVLAGVHDVKTLKLKIKPDSEQKLNSPWNIGTTFKVDMNLSIKEIEPMLEDYSKERGIKMNIPTIVERLFFYTSGYPYLVSKLCKIIDEDIFPIKTVQEWTEEDVKQAFKLLLKEKNNSNFDTLVKNLENNRDLYDLVFSVIFDSERKPFTSDNPVINLGHLHGILSESDSGNIMIHNRIYRERIANLMMSNWQTNNKKITIPTLEDTDFKDNYRLPNRGLNMEKLLIKFQNFMKEQYSDKDRDFLERNGRQIFLAFLNPILNGSGFDFKEPQISDERRLDVVITYNQFKYVCELKLWYGQAAHEKGLAQLADYLERQGLDTGYLVIFDHSQKKMWKKDWTEEKGKRIFWIRV